MSSFSSNTSAVELKTSGTFDFSFERMNPSFYNKNDLGQAVGGNVNKFNAMQRVRIAFDFIASEQLSARYMFQVGKGYWGDTNNSDFSQGQRSGNSAQINTRQAYIDWLVPNTNIRVGMGKKPINLPGFAVSGMIHDGLANGINITAPINDNFAVSLFWMRPVTNYNYDAGITDPDRFFTKDGTVDALGLTVPMKFNGFDFTPYAIVGSMGNDARGFNSSEAWENPWGNLDGRSWIKNGTSNLWWVGFASRLTMFDPFTFALDAAYGSRDASNSDGSPAQWGGREYNTAEAASRAGWYVSALASYKTPYGVPALKGWYASGDNEDRTDKSGRMPTLGCFMPASFGGANSYFESNWGLTNGNALVSAVGTWAVSAQWNKASFIDDLYHDFSVSYVQGTNAKENVYHENRPGSVGAGYKSGKPGKSGAPVGGYLTEKDSFVDINFTTTYNIYKNLATSLELGYLFENFDSDIRTVYNEQGEAVSKPDFRDVWRVAVNFRYTF